MNMRGLAKQSWFGMAPVSSFRPAEKLYNRGSWKMHGGMCPVRCVPSKLHAYTHSSESWNAWTLLVTTAARLPSVGVHPRRKKVKAME
jgi:hypothetical protein